MTQQRSNKEYSITQCYGDCQSILKLLKAVKLADTKLSSRIIYRGVKKETYIRRFISSGIQVLRSMFPELQFQNKWFSKASIMSKQELTFRDKKESFFLPAFMLQHFPKLIKENKLSDFYNQMIGEGKKKKNTDEFEQQFFPKMLCLMVSYFHPEIEQNDQFMIILAITNDNGIKNKFRYLRNLVKKLKYSEYLNVQNLKRYIQTNIKQSIQEEQEIQGKQEIFIKQYQSRFKQQKKLSVWNNKKPYLCSKPLNGKSKTLSSIANYEQFTINQVDISQSQNNKLLRRIQSQSQSQMQAQEDHMNCWCENCWNALFPNDLFANTQSQFVKCLIKIYGDQSPQEKKNHDFQLQQQIMNENQRLPNNQWFYEQWINAVLNLNSESESKLAKKEIQKLSNISIASFQ